MSFFKRIISQESIRNSAKNDTLKGFIRYLDKADSYIIEDEWAFNFFKNFTLADKKKKAEMYNSLTIENT